MEIKLEELNSGVDYKQYLGLMAQLSVVDIDAVTEDSFEKQLEIIRSNPNHKIIVGKDGLKVVGSITILMEPKFIHNISKVAHIEDVVVDVGYRSGGIGKLLLLKAIEVSKENGCYKAILDCSEKNVGFYQKLGFVVKESQMALYFK